LIPLLGQAAAYKIGEGKIHELRKKFEAKEGREYNLVIFWQILSTSCDSLQTK